MSQTPFHRKPVAIACAVVLLHVGGLAALQSGLLVRAYELVVPVEMVSQIIEPPKPEVAQPPPPPAPPVPRPPVPTPAPATPKQAAPPPAPQPIAINDPTPAPNAPVAVPAPPAPLPPSTAPVAAAPAPPATAVPLTPPAPPAPEKIIEPELAAEHQANEELFRPPLASKRLREFGTVVLSVTVGTDGRAKDTVVAKSSGYARLDEAAVRGAKLARFKPATRSGIPIERKFSWPIIYPEPTS